MVKTKRMMKNIKSANMTSAVHGWIDASRGYKTKLQEHIVTQKLKAKLKANVANAL